VILFFLTADVIVTRILRVRRRGSVEQLATITRSYGGQGDGS